MRSGQKAQNNKLRERKRDSRGDVWRRGGCNVNVGATGLTRYSQKRWTGTVSTKIDVVADKKLCAGQRENTGK